MRKKLNTILSIALAGMLFATSAYAGAKIPINDESYIDLGFRVQFLGISTQMDLDGDGEFDGVQDLKARRARFRLKGVVNEKMWGFLQTDISSATGGSGRDMRVIDAFVVYDVQPWAQFYTGINMVPSSRQNVTSSGVMMAIDRPGLNYKTLSWGTKSLSAFNNNTMGFTSSGITGEEDVRDAGVTLFGSGTVGEEVHMKYYAGIYDGIQMAGTDDERMAGRIQFNFGDAEGGYYNSSTYLGKKRTIGVGLSVDTQSSVAADTSGAAIDYLLVSGDVFAEFPMGEHSVTIEGGFMKLDFDGAIRAATTPVDLTKVQGTGFYAEAGILIEERWQPWALYEKWSSDGIFDAGSYTIIRVGVNYYLKGHNANLKAGFESMSSSAALTPSEDSITSMVVGAFVTY